VDAARHPISPAQQVPHLQYFACKSLRVNILDGLAQLESPQVADYRYFSGFDLCFFDLDSGHAEGFQVGTPCGVGAGAGGHGVLRLREPLALPMSRFAQDDTQ
jgi:hypothetical protein